MAEPSPQRSGERLVVSADDPGLEHALVQLLAPTGMAVQAGSANHPARPMTSNGEATLSAARELARREGADVVALLLPSLADGQHTTLVVYDAHTNVLLTRTLTQAPPFTSEDAAATAGMVRTMMNAARRGTATVPDEAPATTASAPTPPPPPVAAVVPAPVSPAAPARWRLRIELGPGLRTGIGATASDMGPPTTYEGTVAEIHGAVGVLSRAFLFGLAGSISASGHRERQGPDDAFAGEARHVTVGSFAGWRFAIGRWLALEATAWLGAHRTSLHGVSGEGDVPVDRATWEAAARLKLRLAVPVYGPLSAGLSGAVEGVWTAQPPTGPPGQRPDMSEDPFLDLHPLAVVDLTLTSPP